MAERRLAPFVPPSGETDFFFSSVVSVLTIAGLLTVQAIFSLVEEAASGHNHLRSMLASAYRELTITGLISFTLFIVSAADLISDHSAALVETENVHVFVLTLAVLYLASVLLLGVLSVTLAKEWDRIELTYAADVAAYRSLKARFLELQQQLGLSLATSEAAGPRGAEGPRAGALTMCSVLRHPVLSREYAKTLSTLRFLEQRYRFIRANSLPSDFSFGAYLRRCKQGVLRELVEVPLGAWMILLACIIGDTLLQSVQSAPTALTSSPPAQILAVSVPVLATSIAVYAKVRSVHWNVLHNAHLSPARMNALKARFGIPSGTDVDGSAEEANPRVMQGLRVQAQKELFWFARPSMLLRAMQASVWGSALASALVVRYWYVFLVPQLDESGESHGVTVSPSAWVALFAFLVGITSLLLLRSVIPLYIVALHTGELVDWRILVEAVDKQRALEKMRRAEARRAAAAAAFETAHGPAPLRERTARRLYHRYTLLPLLTGILASSFFSALLASPKLPSSRMRYGLHVAMLTLLSVLLAEIALRFYTDGATVFFYSLSTLCCRKRQAALALPGASLRGFAPRELFWRSVMHLSDLALTATALCIAIATFVGITEPLYRARIANWNAPGAGSLIDVTPELYAASAIVGVRLARYVFAWRRMRPPPAAFRGFVEWKPEAASPLAQAQSAKGSTSAVAATVDDIAVTVAGDVGSGVGTAPSAAQAADGKQLGSASPPKAGAAQPHGQAQQLSAGAGTAAGIDRTATKLQAMQRASGYFRGDVLRGDADMSALTGQHKARESLSSLPYARATAGAGVSVGGSRRTLAGPSSPRSGGDADADMFYSESTLQEAAARMLAGRLAEQLRSGQQPSGSAGDTPAASIGSNSAATDGAGASAAAPNGSKSSRQLTEAGLAGAGAMPESQSASMTAATRTAGTASGGDHDEAAYAGDGLGELNSNLNLSTLTAAQRRRIRQASDLIGADLLSVLGSSGGSFGGGGGTDGLSAKANEFGAPTSMRFAFPHAAMPAGQAHGGGRRTSLKSLFPGPAPVVAAAVAAPVAPAAPAPATPTAVAGDPAQLPPGAIQAPSAAAAGIATNDQGIRALIAALSAAAQAAAGAAPPDSSSSGAAPALGVAASGPNAQAQAVAAAIAASLASLPTDAKALLRSACDASAPEAAVGADHGSTGNGHATMSGTLHMIATPAASSTAGAGLEPAGRHLTHIHRSAAAGTLDAEPLGARTVPAMHHTDAAPMPADGSGASASSGGVHAHGIIAGRLASDASIMSSAEEDAGDEKWAAFFARADRVLKRSGRSSSSLLAGRPSIGGSAATMHSARLPLERGGSGAPGQPHSGAATAATGAAASSARIASARGAGPGPGPGFGTDRPSVRSPMSLAAGMAGPIGTAATTTTDGSGSGSASVGLYTGGATSAAFRAAVGMHGTPAAAFPVGLAGDSGSSLHHGGDVTGDDGLHLALAVDRSPLPDGAGGDDSPTVGIAAAAAAAAAEGFPAPLPSARRSSLRHVAAERLQALFARRASLLAAGGGQPSLASAVSAGPADAVATASAGAAAAPAPAHGTESLAAAQAASTASVQTTAKRSIFPWLAASHRGSEAGSRRAASPEASRPAAERPVQASRTLGSASGAELAAALHRHVSGSDGGSGGSEASRHSASSSNVFTVSGVVYEVQRPRLRDLFLPPALPKAEPEGEPKASDAPA